MAPDPATKKRPLRDALEPVASALTGHGHTLTAVREAIMAPFHAEGLRPESIKMISDRESLPHAGPPRGVVSAWRGVMLCCRCVALRRV